LLLVDHWIRVHPEQEIKSQHAGDPTLLSQIRPVREYLRLISADERSTAERAEAELKQGTSFYDVARRYSKDTSSAVGGYVGDKALSDLEPKLADIAGGLHYGERSGIEQAGQRWVILERLPRDFRWQADQILIAAEKLRAEGSLQPAMQKAHEALMIYPQFARALRFVGTTLWAAGAPERGAEVMRVAIHLYPDDARSWSELAAMLAAVGDRNGELNAYRKAISLEPDFVVAYLNLGNALLEGNNATDAAKEFRAGLQINPLSADLYDGLAKALARIGDESGSAQARKLAFAIEPAKIKGEMSQSK
jgi:tetratricopeptide (TPR) repeat protein